MQPHRKGENMGVRGELFSSRVILPNRTYFFNVKENRMGDLYLNIVESKNRETGGFDRQSVILFADDLQAFLGGFEESLKVMEKAVREKRHGAPAGRDGSKHGDKRDGEKRDDKRVVFKHKRENQPKEFTPRAQRSVEPSVRDHKGERSGRRPKGVRKFHDKMPDKKF